MPIINYINPQALVHNEDFDLSKVCFDLKTNFVNKPNKALWTSDWNDNINEIAWIQWADWEDFPIKDILYKIIPKRNVKVYEVTTCSDYYAKDLPKTIQHSKIDYFKLQELGFDGFRVTQAGACLGHSSTNGVLQLSVFDCESTVWFNIDWIKSIERIKSLNS